jgi:hypothetical protein
MQSRPRFFLFVPRFPWWGWIFLLPLAVLGVFLGALFLLVFVAAGIIGALVLWIRLKWLSKKTGVGGGSHKVNREYPLTRSYDYELERVDDLDKKDQQQQRQR